MQYKFESKKTNTVCTKLLRTAIYIFFILIGSCGGTDEEPKLRVPDEDLYFDHIVNLNLMGEYVKLDDGNDADTWVHFYKNDSIIKIQTTTGYGMLIPGYTKVAYSQHTQEQFGNNSKYKYGLVFNGVDESGYQTSVTFMADKNDKLNAMQVITFLKDSTAVRDIIFGRYK